MGAVGYLSVETAKPGRNSGCSARWKAPAPLDHGYRRWRILWGKWKVRGRLCDRSNGGNAKEDEGK